VQVLVLTRAKTLLSMSILSHIPLTVDAISISK